MRLEWNLKIFVQYHFSEVNSMIDSVQSAKLVDDMRLRQDIGCLKQALEHRRRRHPLFYINEAGRGRSPHQWAPNPVWVAPPMAVLVQLRQPSRSCGSSGG